MKQKDSTLLKYLFGAIFRPQAQRSHTTVTKYLLLPAICFPLPYGSNILKVRQNIFFTLNNVQKQTFFMMMLLEIFQNRKSENIH